MGTEDVTVRRRIGSGSLKFRGADRCRASAGCRPRLRWVRQEAPVKREERVQRATRNQSGNRSSSRRALN